MLRVLTACCALALALPSTSHAQLLSLGLRGGATSTTMSLSTNPTASRTSFLVGPTATLWMSDAFGIQFDALFVGKGFGAKAGAADTTELDLSYLDVPIVALMHLPSVANGMLQARIQAGPSFSFRMQCELRRDGLTTGFETCNPDNVSTFDVGLIGGAGVKIGRGRGGVTVDATYTYGLLDVNIADDAGFTAKNRALMVSVGVLFPIM